MSFQRESGNKKEEDLIVSVFKRNNIDLVGPNTFGTINSHNSMNVSLIGPFDNDGGVSIFVQSGTLGIVLAYRISKMESIGLNNMVLMGNMAGVDFSDLLDYASNDKNCDVVLMYMKDVKDGKKFIQAAKQCCKPIVVLKGGRTDTGSKAAAFEQAGVHLVNTIEELFMAAELFSMCKIPKGKRVGVLSPGGGANISCVDHCDGLEIPNFTDILQKKIKYFMPSHASEPVNPVDMAAAFGFKDWNGIVYYMSRSFEIDILILNFVMTDGYIDSWDEKLIPELIYTNSPIPIIGSWLGVEGKSKVKFARFIPIFSEPAKAAWAVKLLVKQKEFLEMK